VDAPVLNELKAGCEEWASVVHGHDRDKAHLDLKGLIRLQVQQYGMNDTQISAVNLCTICHDDLFFSYRREGRVIGSMVSGISLLAHS
jgi:copper oxidase (laccase) domain-containing protein